MNIKLIIKDIFFSLCISLVTVFFLSSDLARNYSVGYGSSVYLENWIDIIIVFIANTILSYFLFFFNRSSKELKYEAFFKKNKNDEKNNSK
jgi:ABC-type Fe3+-siderophore transport system permease subunit